MGNGFLLYDIYKVLPMGFAGNEFEERRVLNEISCYVKIFLGSQGEPLPISSSFREVDSLLSRKTRESISKQDSVVMYV